MAITFTQLAAATASTSNTNSYAGNAGTPAAGDLLIAFVVASDTTAAGSMTGQWTWNKLLGPYNGSGASTTSLYIFWAIATAATSTTPTFDCTGDNATGCSIYVLRVAGDSAVLRPYIRQYNTAQGTSTNPAVTLPIAPLTGNGVCGVASNQTNSSTQWTFPTNWTENSEVTYNTPPNSQEVASRASGETSATITWTNSNTTQWLLFAIEIAVGDSVPFPGIEIPKHAKSYKKINDLEIQNRQNTLYISNPNVIVEDPGLLKNKKQIITFEPVNEVIFNQLVIPRKRSLNPSLKRIKTLQSLDVFSAIVAQALENPQVQQENPNKLKAKIAKISDENSSTVSIFNQLVVPRKRTLTPALKRIKAIESFDTFRSIALDTPVENPRAQQENPNKLNAIKYKIPNEGSNTIFASNQIIISRKHSIFRSLRRSRVRYNEEIPNLLNTTLSGVTPPAEDLQPGAITLNVWPRRHKIIHNEELQRALTFPTFIAPSPFVSNEDAGRIGRKPKKESIDSFIDIPLLPVPNVQIDNPGLLRNKLKKESLDFFINPPAPPVPVVQNDNPGLLKNKSKIESLDKSYNPTFIIAINPQVINEDAGLLRRKAKKESLDYFINPPATNNPKAFVENIEFKQAKKLRFEQPVTNPTAGTLSLPVVNPQVQREPERPRTLRRFRAYNRDYETQNFTIPLSGGFAPSLNLTLNINTSIEDTLVINSDLQFTKEMVA